MNYLYWDGHWLHVSGDPDTTDVPQGWSPLWEFKQDKYEGHIGGEVGPVLLSASGGQMIDRRPDRLDREDIPEELLNILLRNSHDARMAHVSIPRPDGDVLGLVVEDHPAIFYKKQRLPITPRTGRHIPGWTSMVDAKKGSPQWLTFWRCGNCNSFIVQMTGTGRVGEYFTETINKKFEKIHDTIEVPDWYLLPTCVECGRFTVTKDDADFIKSIPEQESP